MHRKTSLLRALGGSLALIAALLRAQPLHAQVDSQNTVPPAEVGLSGEKLQLITDFLQREVDEGRISGAVAAVSRHGRIGYLQAVGHSDLQAGKPMRVDSLFRIASMTKPVTSAAVMSLVEDGLVALDDPIAKFLPEFANPVVLSSIDGDSVETQPASGQPTIRDLLTHRSGLTYGWSGPEKLDAIYRHHNIPNLFEPVDETIGDRVDRIAKVPLKFPPGSAWDYGVSTDVLGRVIEVASGLTLDQFFRERFFRPLQMHDTFFYVPEPEQSRLAGLFTLDKNKQLQPVGATPVQSGFLRFSANYCTSPRQPFYSGGGGLVSSVTDYTRFLHMLQRGGEIDGSRVLKRESVAKMTANQIGEMKIPFPDHGDGFGFGFGIVTDRGAATDELSVGSYSWGGIFNTYFWVDPQEQLVGVLMTQLFPNDHLTTRSEFRRLAYEAIDDSGFERVYTYEPGETHANPHFNGRQLRVNAAEVSVHPKFASRSEPRSSGMARILIDEDLRSIRRVDLDTEIWGGHPGTTGKRFTINGRSTHLLPESGTADHNCTHQYPTFNLRPIDLVNGYNSLQFACDQGDTFWGHFIVDNAMLRVGINGDDERLTKHGLNELRARVVATALSRSDGEGFRLRLEGIDAVKSNISGVNFQARYRGYDENGNGWRTDWHGMTKARRPYGTLGSTGADLECEWDTAMLPAQTNVEVRAILEFSDPESVCYRTPSTKGLTIAPRSGRRVSLFGSDDLPKPFWSRDNNVKECTIDVQLDPQDIEAAELHVVAWTGGAGEVSDYFTLNGQHLPVAEGHDHETVYTRLQIKPELLRRGTNRIVLHSDTKHHGIEIMLPGPTLVVRHRTKPQGDDSPDVVAPSSSPTMPSVRLVRSAVDKSAGNLECYRIDTDNATYFLDKAGAGLSSMLDRDGNDWLGFHPRPGSGAAGEYRGFPNAVFKEAGSYFHARNAGTDPCITTVEEETADRVVISAVSDNGLWAARYTFDLSGCTFTMTKKPNGHNYWVLYEGTPGGQYDDSDWWVTSASQTRHPLTDNHDGDITGAEWIAFGDRDSPRMLVLSHAEGDDHPDRFYQMQKKMTVFGFGRAGMKKYLDSVPQSFSIGFVESTDPDVAVQFVTTQTAGAPIKQPTPGNLREIEHYVLTHQGDATAGQKLFEAQRTKCITCHQIGKQGGQVGPNLSSVGGKYDRTHLIDSLLYPSRQIGYGYETTTVVTQDGKVLSGISKETDDTHITLLDSNNKRWKVAKTDIDKSKVSKTSIMPAGLEKSLSAQELTDLVTYLESLGPGDGRFGSGVAGPVQLPSGFELTMVASGLSGATALDVAPDGRIFICEQGGKLRVVKNGKLLDQPFVTIPVEMNWERGLIGVTVSPNFPADPYVYVVYVVDKPYTHHRVSRFRAAGDVAAADSEEILFRGDDQSQFGGKVPAGHQGGAIHFGPDGKLYVGIGEQTAKTPAQRMDALQGKILRINPDGSIPTDNPFLNETSGKYQAIWATGCRNPFTFAFSRSGDMLINDVGGKFEEINPGRAGANYGWPEVDHGPTDRNDVTSPIHIYPQSSINGGDFCDASSPWPEQYHGKYFFADFVHGWVKYIDPRQAQKAQPFVSGIRRPVDLRFTSDGILYVLLRNAWVVDDKFKGDTGSLLRISTSDH